jgi:hypothetical protein
VNVEIAVVFGYNDERGIHLLVDQWAHENQYPYATLPDDKSGTDVANEILREYFSLGASWVLMQNAGVMDNPKLSSRRTIQVYYFCLFPEKIEPKTNLSAWLPLAEVLADPKLTEITQLALRSVGFA